ncbi:MAG: DUF354 domain-containing protein [Candidatus Cloacimonetes bacterium]|nr:DUF354 domain-containing protein [Candidatus Cloacimonadota bacterium]
MNYLIDINHPAQVHYFRNIQVELGVRHKIIYTAKEVPIIRRLMAAYGIPFVSYGKKKDSIISKATKQFQYDWQCYKILKENDIDITLGSSASNVHAALFTKGISIATTDSDLSVLPMSRFFVYPFVDYLMTPDALAFQRHKKQICYPSYQELAYLHPNRFSPDPSVLPECGIKEGEKYFVLRFTAFKAHHDIGMHGLSRMQKRELIDLLSGHGKVFITSEVQDAGFERYALPIEPHKIHSLLYYATMLVCDSQTMTTEAALLGTPAFRCNTFAGKLTVIEEMEKRYGMAFSFLPRHFNWMMAKIKEVLHTPNIKNEWQQRREILLRDKIDVTAFWAWLLENAPASLEQTKQGKVDFDKFR